MTAPVDFTQLGVSGVTVAILVIIIRALWLELREVRAQTDEDRRKMYEALAAATAVQSASVDAMKKIVEEGIRRQAIEERERR